MVDDDVVETTGDVSDRLLEGIVLEGADRAAVGADDVVVMVAVGMARFEAGRRVADFDPRDEIEVREHVQRAVNAREADAAIACAQEVVQLLGGLAAGLAREQVDHGRPCAAAPVPGPPQDLVGMLRPRSHGRIVLQMIMRMIL